MRLGFNQSIPAGYPNQTWQSRYCWLFLGCYRQPSLYYGYDGAGNKIYKKLGNKETFYLKDATGNILSLYEKYEAGDTLSSLDTLVVQHRFLTELIPSYGGSCGDNFDDFFDEYVKPECRKDGLSSAYSFARFYYCSFPSADYWFNIVKPYIDWECVGINLYQKENFSVDTAYLTDLVKNRYKVLARSEAYLYGSSRLGIDTEKKILADSLDFGRYIYNPFCYLYQRLGDIDTTKDSYAVLNDSLVRYNEAGWKRYEFSNHLGNVLAITSDRKIATDTLSGAGNGADYYYADLFSVNDYDPFGMVQPGRSWKRKEKARFGFNGKEREEWEVLDFDARCNSTELGRWLSVDPMAGERTSWTPYNSFRNNPLVNIDPTGALDEWVKTGDGKMVFDSRVTNQEDANILYGSDATYKPNGTSYKASDGSKIELGDYGLFKQNGQIKSSPDLAKNSLAYTNPIQAMAQAQSQIAEARVSCAVALGAIEVTSVDGMTPDPTDFALPKWGLYAVADAIAILYLAKMEREIEGIKRRAGGNEGWVYSLDALTTGQYPVYSWGHSSPTSSMLLNTGDVWKYGETSSTSDRYSKDYLASIGPYGVKYNPLKPGNMVQIKIWEKEYIYGYFLMHGHLPPGNKIFR